MLGGQGVITYSKFAAEKFIIINNWASWHSALLCSTIYTLGAVTPPTPNCSDFSLRLANQFGSTSPDGLVTIQGHVEICIDGSYYAICDEGWDDQDAQVSCNILTNTTGAYSECQH